MENATKALMIAAAILIAIGVITMGVTLLSKGQEAAGDVSLDEYQITEFNNKFLQFQGKNVSGTEVNSLLTTVFNHNLVQEDPTTMVTVGAGTKTASKDPITTGTKTSPAKYATGARYTVTCHYNTATKLITHIQVTTNK